MSNTINKLIRCGCSLVIGGLALSYIPYTAKKGEPTLKLVSNTAAAIGVGVYCVGSIVSTLSEK